MIAAALRAAPYVSLAALLAWTGVEVSRITWPRWDVALEALFLLGAGCAVLGQVPRLRPLRRLGLVLLGAAYVGARVLELGVDVIPAVAYVTLGIVHVELRVLAERFGPLYERELPQDTRRGIDAALARATMRIGLATGLALLVPILAADLALTGAVPLTTVPTAIFLAVAFVLTAALLALLPVLERRGPQETTGSRMADPSRPKA